MNERFSRDYIDRLLQSVSLFDLMVEKGVQVRDGIGKNAFYVAEWCCSKTDDDNGRIDKIKNTYKCMSCGEQGNSIHFLRRFSQMSYFEAVHLLCEKANIALPSQKEPSRRAKALQLAANFFQDFSHPYLLNRGISQDILNKIGAGYAPGGRKLRSYMESEGFTKDELLTFGLINSKGLDAFFHRAIIPIMLNGNVIDLYGRAVDDAASKVPHFYADGSKVFGGIDNIDHKKIVNLFEAPIDRLVAASHGITNGVDPGGATKFNQYHVSLLKRQRVRTVAIWFDGDDAGRNGAMLAGQLLIKEGIEVYIVELPKDQDVASILQNEGRETLFTYSRAVKPFDIFQLHCFLDKYSVEHIEDYLAKRYVIVQ